MTCIDKLRELHPDWDDEKVRHYVERHCVANQYIMPRAIYCGSHGWEESESWTCERCWNREVFEDERHNRHDLKLRLTGEDMRRLGRLYDRTGYSRDRVVSAALLLYEDGLDAVDEAHLRMTRVSFEFEMEDKGGELSGGV